MDKNVIHGQVSRFDPRPFPGLPRIVRLIATLCLIATSGTVFSQTGDSQSPLFATDDILEIRLSGDIRSLMDERTPDSEYYPITLSYQEQGNSYRVPIKVKTRGHFRLDRANC